MKSSLTKAYLIALIVVVLDQLSKWLLLDIVQMPEREHITLAPFFNLVMVWNRGISFGMMQGLSHPEYVLGGVALVIVAVLTIWLKKVERLREIIGIGIIIGGAVGNFIDRLRFGAVADFFDFHVAGYHWPAFNIADAAICIGAFLLVLESVYEKKPR